MAEISVIVPIYNVEPYLRRCLDSILCQTFLDFDLVLVDDGSPDQCGAICDEFAKNDARIHVIHQKNGGLSAARNAGIEWSLNYSNSQWISFIDSDDWVHPMYLELLLKAIKETGSDVAIGGFIGTYGDAIPSFNQDEKKAVLRRVDEYYTKHIINFTVSWGKLYKKTFYERIRFPVGKIHEDEYTTYRILFQQEYVAVVELPLYAYFQNDKGIINGEWTPRRLDALQALEEQISFFTSINRIDLAKFVFTRLIYIIMRNKQRIDEAKSLSLSEKKKYKAYLKKRLQRALIRQRRYKLYPFRESEDNKKVYVEAFPIIGVMRMLWSKVKKALKKLRPTYILGKFIKHGCKQRSEWRKVLKYIRGTALKKAIILQSPLHGNIGDQAIITAELEVLRRLHIPYADYPWTQGIEKTVARLTSKRCIILQHGGGYLGQLWPNEENRFQATLRSFTNNKIIVFPQTIYFDMETEEGRKCFEQSRKIYQSHHDLTVFVREHYSYDFMQKYMPEVKVQLVPDMAMLLDPLKGRDKPDRQGVMLCMRSDKEKKISSEMYERLQQFLADLEESITITDTAFGGDVDIRDREQLLEEKLSEFLTSSLVITDRLHGMIFAAITETPCIVLDSLSHKLRGCYEWIKDLDYIRFAENVEDVPMIIEELKTVKPQYNRGKIEKAMKPLYEALLKATK